MTKTDLEIAMRQSFRIAARNQRVCAMPECTNGTAFQPHHVVYEQHLRAKGLPKYTTTNALRLCPTCHRRHHGGSKVVPVSALTDDNVEYAFYALGPAAYDYLKRYYAGHDPRLEHHLELAEASAP